MVQRTLVTTNMKNIDRLISESWGIAVFPQDRVTDTELLKSANMPCTRKKILGKNRRCFFDHKEEIMLQYNNRRTKTQIVNPKARVEYPTWSKEYTACN